MYSSFCSSFYPSNYNGFTGHTLAAGTTIENLNTVSASCNLTLSTAENLISDAIKIYPNPAKDFLTINLKKSDEKIELITIYGQVVYEKIDVSDMITLPVSNYSNGIYFLRISNNKDSKSYKVIIDK